MKTNVQATSVEALYSIDLNRREKELLAILEGDMSDRDMARKLGWEISSVNGRRNSLVEKGRVEESYRATSPATGRRVIYWRLKLGQISLL